VPETVGTIADVNVGDQVIIDGLFDDWRTVTRVLPAVSAGEPAITLGLVDNPEEFAWHDLTLRPDRPVRIRQYQPVGMEALIAATIRRVDGQHTMGAGSLAEAIMAALNGVPDEVLAHFGALPPDAYQALPSSSRSASSFRAAVKRLSGSRRGRGH